MKIAVALVAVGLWVAIHIEYVPIVYRGSLRDYWRDSAPRMLWSKSMFVLAVLSCGLLAFSFSLAAIVSTSLVLGHGLLAIRR